MNEREAKNEMRKTTHNTLWCDPTGMCDTTIYACDYRMLWPLLFYSICACVRAMHVCGFYIIILIMYSVELICSCWLLAATCCGSNWPPDCVYLYFAMATFFQSNPPGPCRCGILFFLFSALFSISFYSL